MKIIGAEVFDPALSGDYDTPTRLEIRVDNYPDEPTHVDLGAHFTVTHRHWLASIFADSGELLMDGWKWDDEDTRHCAAVYNTLTDDATEAVMPVTVLAQDKTGLVWQDFYVKLERVRRILNKTGRLQGTVPYELVPDETYVEDKMIAWTIRHPTRVCVRCAQDMAASTTAYSGVLVNLDDLPQHCELVRVRRHRMVPMCTRHRAEWNQERKEQRQRESI